MPTDFGMASTKPQPMLGANVIAEAAKGVKARDGFAAPFLAAERYESGRPEIDKSELNYALYDYLMRQGNPALAALDNKLRSRALLEIIKQQNAAANAGETALVKDTPSFREDYTKMGAMPGQFFPTSNDAFSKVFEAFGR